MFAALAGEGRWIVISGDYRITRTRAERQAFIDARLTGFFLGTGAEESTRPEAVRAPVRAVEQRRHGRRALFELPIKSTRIRQIKL